MFAQIDISRREKTLQLDMAKRSELGQFFTPYRIARFMASLFRESDQTRIRVLDAGAGIGSLSVAVLERYGAKPRTHVEVLGYELDGKVCQALRDNLAEYAAFLGRAGIEVLPEVIGKDFIQEGVMNYLLGRHKSVDFAILNPPYRKINSKSAHRALLRKVGIETVNLYSGFVALSILLLKPKGELVAIIPRSFCNGPYYRPFREFLLERTCLKQIHIFEARNKAFQDDEVLQENIIIHLVKGEKQKEVKISSSVDGSFAGYEEFTVPFTRIVSPDDREQFIHIPTAKTDQEFVTSGRFTHSLSDLGIQVSTGPVVDFRVKDFLRQEPEMGTAPLLYPAHFGDKTIVWPKPGFKKSNALVINLETKKQFFPAGFYTLVRRFSSKEEKRRIVARVLTPRDLPGELVGFENHLNVFHQNKKGLSEELALGLAVYLNSTMIDAYFRQFNGHTQVNATDLRLLKYPSKADLIDLGQWAKGLTDFDQQTIDSRTESLLCRS